MRLIRFIIVIATLLGSLAITPASAAPYASECGDSYIVRRGDYLKWIANYCGLTYQDILDANPQIYNPNLIYPGQVISLVPGSGIPDTSNSSTNTPDVTGQYVVQWGDTLSWIAYRYGTSVGALMAVNPQIHSSWLIYTGQVINIPSGSVDYPTYPTNPPSTNTYTSFKGYARISISSRAVAPGGALLITVSGFPANSIIDLRIGPKDGAPVRVIDAKTNASGYYADNILMPESAVSGETWIVRALTTEIRNGVEVVSPTITIR